MGYPHRNISPSAVGLHCLEEKGYQVWNLGSHSPEYVHWHISVNSNIGFIRLDYYPVNLMANADRLHLVMVCYKH